MSDFHTKTVETSPLDPREHPPQRPPLALVLEALQGVVPLAQACGSDIQDAVQNFIASLDRRKPGRPWTIEDHRARRRTGESA